MSIGGTLGVAIELVGRDVGFGKMLETMRAGFGKMVEAAETAKTKMLDAFGAVRDGALNVFKPGPLLAGLQDFAKNASEFNAAMRQVKVFAGAGAEGLEESRKAIFSVNTALKGLGTAEASAAFGHLVTATNSVQDAQALLQPSLVLTSLKFGEPAAAAEFLTRTLTQFRLEATDGARVTDVIAFGMRNFGLQADEARTGFQGLTKGVATSKATLEDATLAALLAGQAMRDGFAGGGRVVGRALEEASLDAKKSFKRLGGEDAGDILGAFEKLAAMFPTKDAKKFTESLVGMGKLGKFEIKALGSIFEGAGQLIEKSGGSVTTVRGAIQKLRDDVKSSGGLGERMAQGLASGQSVISAAWNLIVGDAARAVKAALKPIEDVVKAISVAFYKFWETIPVGAKNTIAKVIVFVAALGSLGGALIALKFLAGAALSVVFALGPGILAAAVLMAPLYIAVLLTAGALYTLKRAYDENLGGFADRANKFVGDVQKVWRGVVQVFTTGGELSGDVLKDLNDNPELKKLVGKLYAVGYRLGEFWDGLVFQFDRVFETLDPIFKRIGNAFEQLLGAFFGKGAGIEKLATSSTASWFKAGQEIGDVLGSLVKLISEGLATALEAVAGILTESGPGWERHKDSWIKLKDAGKGLWDTVLKVTGGIEDLFVQGADGESTFIRLKTALDSVKTADFVTGLNTIIEAMEKLIRAGQSVKDHIEDLGFLLSNPGKALSLGLGGAGDKFGSGLQEEFRRRDLERSIQRRPGSDLEYDQEVAITAGAAVRAKQIRKKSPQDYRDLQVDEEERINAETIRAARETPAGAALNPPSAPGYEVAEYLRGVFDPDRNIERVYNFVIDNDGLQTIASMISGKQSEDDFASTSKDTDGV